MLPYLHILNTLVTKFLKALFKVEITSENPHVLFADSTSFFSLLIYVLFQENMCWSMHMNPYTFGSSSYGTDSYYGSYEVNDHLSRLGISGRQWEYPSVASTEEPTRIEDTQTEAHAETSVDEYHEEGYLIILSYCFLVLLLV